MCIYIRILYIAYTCILTSHSVLHAVYYCTTYKVRVVFLLLHHDVRCTRGKVHTVPPMHIHVTQTDTQMTVYTNTTLYGLYA